jgi:tRNA1(Val) A37 N6-methylase TrmN6
MKELKMMENMIIGNPPYNSLKKKILVNLDSLEEDEAYEIYLTLQEKLKVKIRKQKLNKVK